MVLGEKHGTNYLPYTPKLANIVNIRKGVITDNARPPISITRYFIKAVLNVAIFVPICNLSPKL